LSLTRFEQQDIFEDDYELLQQGAMMMVNLRNPNFDIDDEEEDSSMITTSEMVVTPDSIFGSDNVDTS